MTLKPQAINHCISPMFLQLLDSSPNNIDVTQDPQLHSFILGCGPTWGLGHYSFGSANPQVVQDWGHHPAVSARSTAEHWSSPCPSRIQSLLSPLLPPLLPESLLPLSALLPASWDWLLLMKDWVIFDKHCWPWSGRHGKPTSNKMFCLRERS